MPTPWLNRIRRTGQLTVHNMAGTWAVAVDSAIAKFNVLGLGVKLVPEKVKDSANVVVKMSDGSEVYPYYGDKATANFNAPSCMARPPPWPMGSDGRSSSR